MKKQVSDALRERIIEPRPDSQALAAAKEIRQMWRDLNHSRYSPADEETAAIIAKHYAPKLEAAEKMEKALTALRKKSIGLVWEAMGTTGDDSDWFQCEMCGARARGNPFTHDPTCPMYEAATALAAWKATQ